jgi:GTPase SAR1 family protein
MTHVYYQEAVGALVVFDLTRLTTLEMVAEWKKDIDAKVFTSEDSPIPCILLGNKIDLCADGKWGKSREEVEALARNQGFVGYFETSAKDGRNVETAARELVKYIIENKIEPQSDKDQGVDLSASPTGRKSSGCCS